MADPAFLASAIYRSEMIGLEDEAAHLRRQAAELQRQAKAADRKARMIANRFLAVNGYTFAA